MNDVERLREKLVEQFPTFNLHLTEPAVETGGWFLDLIREGDSTPIVIEWRPTLGFGITTPEDGVYGAGVDEIYPDREATYNRVVELVLADGVTDGHPVALKKSLPL